MSKAREIKRRLASIKSTGKITRAMQMVSASKMKKAQDGVAAAVPYAEGLFRIIQNIGKIQDYQSPFTRNVHEVNSIAIVVIGPDRGFVGGLNSNLLLEADKLVNRLRLKYQGVNIKGISLHRKGLKIIENLGIKQQYHFSDYVESPTTTDLTPIIKVLREGFVNEDFDEVYLVFTHFINTAVQESVTKKILPTLCIKITHLALA